jgi:hypothetical protein
MRRCGKHAKDHRQEDEMGGAGQWGSQVLEPRTQRWLLSSEIATASEKGPLAYGKDTPKYAALKTGRPFMPQSHQRGV